jgi:hypothetical protein
VSMYSSTMLTTSVIMQEHTTVPRISWMTFPCRSHDQATLVLSFSDSSGHRKFYAYCMTLIGQLRMWSQLCEKTARIALCRKKRLCI